MSNPRIILVEKGSILVESMEKMVSLLDQDWIVKEEISKDSFLMQRVRARALKS